MASKNEIKKLKNKSIGWYGFKTKLGRIHRRLFYTAAQRLELKSQLRNEDIG